MNLQNIATATFLVFILLVTINFARCEPINLRVDDHVHQQAVIARQIIRADTKIRLRLQHWGACNRKTLCVNYGRYKAPFKTYGKLNHSSEAQATLTGQVVKAILRMLGVPKRHIGRGYQVTDPARRIARRNMRAVQARYRRARLWCKVYRNINQKCVDKRVKQCEA